MLKTDKYKLVMAQAGFALRPETFVFMLRKGGPFFLPLDIKAYIETCMPQTSPAGYAYLEAQGLHMDGAYRRAMNGQVEVLSLPKGSWFHDRTPICTVTGPSALVSHLEAQLIWLQFPIQVATLAKRQPETLAKRLGVVTCQAEKDLILRTLDSVGVPVDFEIRVDEAGYYRFIYERAKALIEAVDDPTRVMEAGMRAVSCMQQHEIALRACKDAGFLATSNLFLAHKLALNAAGTTGHEHTQRWGGDYRAFTAVRDRIPGNITYLLDTYSTLGSGLPNALRVLSEDPGRAASIRFDSESTMLDDYAHAVKTFKDAGLEPGINLGGGFNLEKTLQFESLGRGLGWPRAKQRYMYGQYLVQPHSPLPTRGDVGAVYKLSQSGARATMKFSDNPQKSSIPGEPTLWIPQDIHSPLPNLIGQKDERLPRDYRLVSGSDEPVALGRWQVANPQFQTQSPGTLHLMKELEGERARMDCP